MDIGKTIGLIILIGIASFWVGRFTGKPEIRTEIIRLEPDRIYSLPACLEAVCKSLYPTPLCHSKSDVFFLDGKLIDNGDETVGKK